MLKIVIVLISASDFINPREICKEIEGNTFKDGKYLIEKLNEDLEKDSEVDEIEAPTYYTLSDFTDAVNDQELDTFDNYFICYVTLEN